MKNDISKLSSIKSKDILKIIFSNVQIIHVLKLIKYNKNTENRLGITKEAFEDNSDLPKLKTEKKTEITKRLMYILLHLPTWLYFGTKIIYRMWKKYEKKKKII